MVRAADLALMADAYLAGRDPKTPLASPLYANLAGLPPLLLQVGSAEILLDDAVRVAERARGRRRGRATRLAGHVPRLACLRGHPARGSAGRGGDGGLLREAPHLRSEILAGERSA
jgi:alpha/beta hydrolase fold